MRRKEPSVKGLKYKISKLQGKLMRDVGLDEKQIYRDEIEKAKAELQKLLAKDDPIESMFV